MEVHRREKNSTEWFPSTDNCYSSTFLLFSLLPSFCPSSIYPSPPSTSFLFFPFYSSNDLRFCIGHIHNNGKYVCGRAWYLDGCWGNVVITIFQSYPMEAIFSTLHLLLPFPCIFNKNSSFSLKCGFLKSLHPFKCTCVVENSISYVTYDQCGRNHCLTKYVSLLCGHTAHLAVR